MSFFGGIDTSKVKSSPTSNAASKSAASAATAKAAASKPTGTGGSGGASKSFGGINTSTVHTSPVGSNSGGGASKSFGGINTSTIHTAPMGSNSGGLRGSLGMQQGSNSFNSASNSGVRSGIRNPGDNAAQPTQKAARDYGTSLQNYLTRMGEVRRVNSSMNTTTVAKTPAPRMDFGTEIQNYTTQMGAVRNANRQLSLTGAAKTPQLNLTTVAKTPAPPRMDFGTEIQNYIAAETAARKANTPKSRSIALNSGVTPKIADEFGGPVPAQSQAINTATPPVPRMKSDANLSFLNSRGSSLDLSNMNPDFVNSFSNALRAAEAATGAKAQILDSHRDPKIQAQYRANYTGKSVTWEGKTYNPQRKGGLAARPGLSRHQLGAATDIAAGPVRDWMIKNSRQFGIGRLAPALAAIDGGHFQQIGARPSARGPTISYNTALDRKYAYNAAGEVQPTMVASVSKPAQATKITTASTKPTKQVSTSNMLTDLIAKGKELGTVASKKFADASQTIKKYGGPERAVALAKLMQGPSAKTLAQRQRTIDERSGGTRADNLAVLAFLKKYPQWAGATA